MPITKLRIARGLKSNLPVPPVSFEPGRPYFATDTRELYIGTGFVTPMSLVGTSSSGLNFTGEWSILANYLPNDLVTWNNTLYIAVNANTGEQPDLFPSDWEVVVTGNSAETFTLTTGEAIAAFKAISLHSDGLAYKADANIVADAGRIVGVSTVGAGSGASITVLNDGEINNLGFGFLPGKQVFLGLNGALVQSPGLGLFEQPMGVAISASDLIVQVGTPIVFV